MKRWLCLLGVLLLWSPGPAAAEEAKALIVDVTVLEKDGVEETRSAELLYLAESEESLILRLPSLPDLEIVPGPFEADSTEIDLSLRRSEALMSSRLESHRARVGVPVLVSHGGERLMLVVREVIAMAPAHLERRLLPVADVEISPGMPEVLFDDEGTRLPEGVEVVGTAPRLPAFVRADVVLDADGRVSEDFFLESTREMLQRWIDSAEGCERRYEVDTTGFDTGRRRDSLAVASASADWVGVAQVTGRAPGFAGLRAGTLLRVQPIETLKGDPHRTREHFLFVEVGAFEIGDRRICSSGDWQSLHADLPEVGERVAFFLQTEWQNRALFLDASAEDLLTIRNDGTVSLPASYRSTDRALSDKSFDATLGHLRTSLEGGVR